MLIARARALFKFMIICNSNSRSHKFANNVSRDEIAHAIEFAIEIKMNVEFESFNLLIWLIL